LLRAKIGEENIKSITYDNGLEFAKYSAALKRRVKMPSIFC